MFILSIHIGKSYVSRQTSSPTFGYAPKSSHYIDRFIKNANLQCDQAGSFITKNRRWGMRRWGRGDVEDKQQIKGQNPICFYAQA